MITRASHAPLHVEIRSEAVGEDLVRAVGAAVLHRLEHDVEAGLRKGRAIPRAMEGNECSIAIVRGKGRAGVEEQSVGRPMRGEISDIPLLRVASPNLFAVAAILGGEDFLLLLRVEVAVRPAEVVAALNVEKLFGRQLCTLFSRE